MRILIVGCGYLGLALGRRLVLEGHEVWGMRRSEDGRAEMEAAGIQFVVGDMTKDDGLRLLPSNVEGIVNALSSKGGGVDGYRSLYLEGTQRLLDAVPSSGLKRYVHISSTSVYGQQDGSWVTEISPAKPVAETSQVLVATEQLLVDAWRQFQYPALILRSAGIYGPGRGHLYQQFLKGEARLTGEGTRWLNMIHRDDLVGMICAALDRGESGEIYNAADSQPVTEREFFEWLSLTTSRPMPEMSIVSATARKRGATNKRVSNRKVRELLGYVFQYPTFRDGYLPLANLIPRKETP